MKKNYKISQTEQALHSLQTKKRIFHQHIPVEERPNYHTLIVLFLKSAKVMDQNSLENRFKKPCTFCTLAILNRVKAEGFEHDGEMFRL